MTTDAQILLALRQAGINGLPGTELSSALGISRAAIWAHIEELRSLGYEIEASPHQGYRLIASPDLLHSDDLLSRLTETREIGRDIRVFKETTSTNEVAEKLARDGVEGGVIVIAESQTRGKGRLGRKWISPSGKGLWLSVLLRPKLRPSEMTQVTVIAATALVRAIQTQTGLQPRIKWPNDVLCNGRKVAGVLTEMSAEPDRVRHVILGIGVDVNLDQSDFPPELREVASSLKLESGAPVSRPDLAVQLLVELDRDYCRIVDGRFSEVTAEWERCCSTVGHDVSIRQGNRTIRGRAEALDSEGALLLRTAGGQLERIIGGDVTLEK